LICGLPGSGKTTLAKSIAASTGSIRLCPDEWIKDIWDDTAETEGNNYRGKIEKLQWNLAKQILQNAMGIIIEWGTWGKNERATLRDGARALGAKVIFYYLDVPREILKKRILERNKDLGHHEFYIPENEIEKFLDDSFKSLQIPTDEELATYDAIG